MIKQDNLNKYYTYILLIISIIILSAAFILEYIFNFIPCKICYYQRIPYFLIILLCFINIIIKNIRYKSINIWIIIIVLVFNMILSLYHVAIEVGYIENIISCTSDNITGSVSELKKALLGKINVPCEVVKFKFILSLSGWNFFISLLLGIISLRHILYLKKIIKYEHE